MSVKNREAAIEIRFRRKYPWAILPYKERLDREAAEAEAALYADNFRWIRRERSAILCWPWRLAQEIGWIIPSPIDIEVSPLEEAEVDVPVEERPAFTASTGLTEFWPRRSSENPDKDQLMASETASWIRASDVLCDGKWEPMFYPLGEGAVEWPLGWTVDIPPGYFLITLPLPELSDAMEVPSGILDARNLQQLNRSWGMSIAIRPKKTLQLRRRQPVARMVLLHRDSLRVRAVVEEDAWNVPDDNGAEG